MLFIVAAVLGWWEAVGVVYLREILAFHNTVDLTNLVISQIPRRIILIEQTREICPIVIMVVLALVIERNWWRRVAAFLFTFAVWDLVYYLGLKILVNWPESLATLDCLFLIPVPWIAPVWVPIACMTIFIFIAGYIFYVTTDKP